MTDHAAIESLEQQLITLYQERERLNDTFGVSDTDGIVNMVRSLEGQLRDFYDRFGGNPGFDDAETALMLSKIRDLSAQLDPMFTAKRVSFFVENDRPVLRAEWSAVNDQGDQK